MKLVDTDILIDFSRKLLPAVGLLTRLENQGNLNISQVTEMEYLLGCRNNRELDQAKEFLSRFRVVPLKESSSHLASELLCSFHLRYGIGILDCLIAATSLTEKLPLVSRNKKHYQKIPNLVLEIPY